MLYLFFKLKFKNTLTEQEEKKTAPRRKKFIEKYNELTESEIQKEQLFIQQLTLEKLESIRANTNKLVWLIIIPFIISLIYIVFAFGRYGSI